MIHTEGHRRASSGRVVPLASFVLFGVVTGLTALYSIPGERNDWRLFYDTAELVLSHRIDELYPGITAGYPFLYPPPFVWLVAWLALLPPVVAHAALVCAMVLAVCAALALLHKTLASNGEGKQLSSWIFFVLSSAGWVWMLHVGHVTGWLVLLASLALVAWTSGHLFCAGVALGGLAIKPHYFVPLVACALLGGSRRVVLGALATCVVLGLTTLPLGLGVWTSYLAQLGSVGTVMARIPPWKQITVLSFWRSVLVGATPRVVGMAFVASIAPCVLLVAMAWLKHRATRRLVPRLFAVSSLMIVCCNAYSFHYDGLLLSIPAAVWYLRARDYTCVATHRAIGAAIAVTFVVQHASAMLFQRGVALTGPIVAVWLVLETLDIIRASAEPGAVGGSPTLERA